MRRITYKKKARQVLKCGDSILNLGSRTYIMGILNVTPDSFSDGGNYIDVEKAVSHAKDMVKKGADIIDIGGESTRPGSVGITSGDELKRILAVLKRLIAEIEIPISVDTYKAQVAEKVLQLGVEMINDVWGLQRDPYMAQVVGKYQVPIVIMHNQRGNKYKKDIIEELKDYFETSIALALKGGIKEENIIIDPGIGFGKDLNQNIELMGRLGELTDLGYPILLGTSRKSMIGKVLNLPASDRVEGTLATSVMGIIQGIDIIRVHDIQENLRAIRLTDRIVRVENG